MSDGLDDKSTAMALAKQLLMDCEGDGEVILPKGTLKIVLMAFIKSWHANQDAARATFKKAAM